LLLLLLLLLLLGDDADGITTMAGLFWVGGCVLTIEWG
jgi:hypothetical protein